MGCPDCGWQSYEAYYQNCYNCEPEKFEPCGASGCPSWVEPVYGPNGAVVDEVVYECEVCGGSQIVLKPEYIE